jgi:ATP-dependent exoDNAse (exonuclease V) beta subunit
LERDIFDVKKTNLKSKLQSLYVACTRARKRVYIYNGRSKVDNSLLPAEILKEIFDE